jgi:energy-coupling factor transport system ATP-binding protein
MRIVAEYADSVAVLVDGEIQFHGSPAALFDEPETLSSAHLSRPPLAELTDRISWFSGVATVERCLERCNSAQTETRSHDLDSASRSASDDAEER